MFDKRIGVLDTTGEPVFYRLGAVSKTDIDAITNHSKSHHARGTQLYNGYTGNHHVMCVKIPS
jgi:hypothetical protein